MSQSKRKQFNIKEKSLIISKLESGIPNKVLAKEYNVPHSTISTIWKKREKIITLYDRNYLKLKRARTTKHIKIDEALLKWSKNQQANNVPINGPILQQKANEFARDLGEDFICSASWIQRFRVRHGIDGRKIHSEPAIFNVGVLEEWKTQNWPIFYEGYGPDDIFNADECGFFYNMTPDETLNFKGENCSDGKMSKMRLTILVAANMTGSYKRKLLVVGKPKKPRCFKNIHSLPVMYENNAKSWMTSKIFERWLRNWDSELQIHNRKILLLVDNCSAHRDVTNLNCIKLAFLPPNINSELQPLNQGIIKCLKSHYRRLQVLKLIQNQDSNDQKTFTILDAIFMISEAWEKVSQNTIANCFRHAGFKDLLTISSDDDTVPSAQLFSVIDNDEECYISLAKLAQNLQPALSDMEAEQFIDVDNSIAICAPTTEDEIVPEAQKEIEENDKETEEQFKVPSLYDGLNAISDLRKIILFKDQLHIQGSYDDALVKFQCELQNSYVQQKMEPTEIDD